MKLNHIARSTLILQERLPISASIRSTTALLLPESKLRQFIRQIRLSRTTWATRIARRNVQARIPLKEVARSKQQSHRLGRHNRIVFRSWEVRDAERVPEDDIRVCNRFVGVRLNPRWETCGGLARGLRNVAASRMDLLVGV